MQTKRIAHNYYTQRNEVNWTGHRPNQEFFVCVFFFCFILSVSIVCWTCLTKPTKYTTLHFTSVRTEETTRMCVQRNRNTARHNCFWCVLLLETFEDDIQYMQSTDNHQLSPVIEHDERIINTGNYYNIISVFSIEFRAKLTRLELRMVDTYYSKVSIEVNTVGFLRCSKQWVLCTLFKKFHSRNGSMCVLCTEDSIKCYSFEDVLWFVICLYVKSRCDSNISINKKKHFLGPSFSITI